MTGGPQSDDRRDPQYRRPGDLAGIDKQGLLFDDMDDLRDFQIPYAKNRKQLGVAAENRMGLVDTIKMASPTILLGCSTVHGAFTRAVIQAMAASTERPLIFPISNPTSRIEADAGRCNRLV